MKRRKYKLKKSALLFMVFVFMLVLLLGVQALAAGAAEEPECVQMTVHSGDTLWALIHAAVPDYDGDMNKAIYEVKQLNGLSSADIYPGQKLLIPLNF